MLTYQDVVTIRLGALTEAAAAWDATADGFKDLEAFYASGVEDLAHRGSWTGVSAEAAAKQFAATRKQYADAQTEARAVAALLRDAHGQFSRRIDSVKELVEQARKNGLSVNHQGEAALDVDRVKQEGHGPGYENFLGKEHAVEAAWTKSIEDAVRAVDDTDQGVKLALHKAAGVKGFFENILDPLGLGHTFNGKADDAVEVVKAHEAKQYADQILAGQKPDDLAEWQRLMHDNSGNKVFSQTLLDSLGVDKTLRLSNKLDDLAYFDDTRHKDAYLNIAGGLSDSLATAMRVPDFTDRQGRRVPFGTAEYQGWYKGWQQTPDADFYSRWMGALGAHGGDKYDLEAVADKVPEQAKGEGQQVRGYQTLATLMQQGHAYSPQFVADVTDGMIAAEKQHPHLWNLYGKFDNKNGDGWFANDPVDAALGVLSHDPGGAAGYLDPGTKAGKERFDYLLGHGSGSRDWDVANTTRWGGPGGNVEYDASNVLDVDDRKGLGDVLTAAATGISPSALHPGPTSHTDANDRVFQQSLETLSQQGDDMPPSLRDDMAKIMTNHSREVYATMGTPNQDLAPLDQSQVLEITKQISRDQQSYGMLHEGMQHAIVESFTDRSRKPEDTLSSAGYAVGFMEEGRYLALKGDQHDYTWDKAWSYHTSGALLNFIPGYGDLAQRGADAVTTAWIIDEQKRQADQLTSDSQMTYDARRRQLNALADQWYAANSRWAESHTGYSNRGIYNQIATAANGGNSMARGIAGAQ
ncbi:hypothetical protein [Streptomyces sp. CBMA152]|uniref:hypothetical protein n=1 Tax=Streptomyces sp. CBMA152 TaxID=1896312 RepID=UPI0016602D48|nr:hypothetical protein [Streptomyces sp. CBMA152]MBD0743063.1 hypothetical protein [Streptomyces sp. CBMA152]